MQKMTVQNREIHTDGSEHDRFAVENATLFLPVERMAEAGFLIEANGQLYTPRAAFAAGVGPFSGVR